MLFLHLLLSYFLLCFSVTFGHISQESYVAWIHRFDIAIEAQLLDRAYYTYILIEGAYNYDKSNEAHVRTINKDLAAKNLLHGADTLGPEFLQKLSNQLKPEALPLPLSTRTPSPPPPVPAAYKKESFKVPPFATNGLLFFLNDDPKGINDPVVMGFMTALQEKACPIAVSFNTMLAIIGRLKAPILPQGVSNPSEEFIKKALETTKRASNMYNFAMVTLGRLIRNSGVANKQAIVSALNGLTGFLHLLAEPPLTQEQTQEVGQMSFLFRMVGFKPEEWIIKYIGGPEFILFIPRTYKNLGAYTSSSKALKRSDNLTPIELELGLKIDHMDGMPSEQFIKTFGTSWPAAKQEAHTEYFRPSFDQLFVTNAEYKKYNVPFNELPRWVFYMVGHGAMGSSICNLPINTFNRFLDRIEHEIVTQLFIYISCFGVGETLKDAFQDATGKIKKYSYAIATEGVADSSVLLEFSFAGVRGAFSERYIDFKHERFRFSLGGHFQEFMHQVMQTDSINYTKVLGTLLPTAADIKSIVQLRLPGLEWFSFVDFNEHALVIDSALIKTQDGIPLSIRDYFAKKGKAAPTVEGILVELPVVPCDLIIDVGMMPKIISMMPGAALHSFNKITVKHQREYVDIIRAFYEAGQEARKIFTIKSLEFPEQPVKTTFTGIKKTASKFQNVIIATGFEHGKQATTIYVSIDGIDFEMLPTGELKRHSGEHKELDAEIKRVMTAQSGKR